MVMRAFEMDAMYHDLERPSRKRSIYSTHLNEIADGPYDNLEDQGPLRKRSTFTTDLKESTTHLKETDVVCDDDGDYKLEGPLWKRSTSTMQLKEIVSRRAIARPALAEMDERRRDEGLRAAFTLMNREELKNNNEVILPDCDGCGLCTGAFCDGCLVPLCRDCCTYGKQFCRHCMPTRWLEE